MRQSFVVLDHVEPDQLFDGLDTVERVQEEPLVLQRTPPGLDHRVREAQIGHGQDTTKQARRDQLVDVAAPSGPSVQPTYHPPANSWQQQQEVLSGSLSFVGDDDTMLTHMQDNTISQGDAPEGEVTVDIDVAQMMADAFTQSDARSTRKVHGIPDYDDDDSD